MTSHVPSTARRHADDRRAGRGLRRRTVPVAVGAAARRERQPGGLGWSVGGSVSSSSAAPSAQPSTSGLLSTLLVLRVESVGGLIAPGFARSQLPSISVFADGRIIVPGVIPAIYPGPLVMPLFVRSVGTAGAAAILKAAKDAGLTKADATYPVLGVADMPSTVITVVHDGARTKTTFGALSPDAAQNAPPAEAALRSAALALIGHLSTGDTYWGPTTASVPYEPAGYRVWVTRGAPQASDPSLQRQPVAWPLAAPLASFGAPDPSQNQPTRVGDVVGTDAALLGPIVTAATQITPFSSAGAVYTLVVRPLLPDEAAAARG